MRRSIFVTMLAGASLVAIWSFASWAQIFDSSPCRESCHEQQSECVSACGEHNNPIECEERCDDDLEDCLRDCR